MTDVICIPEQSVGMLWGEKTAGRENNLHKAPFEASVARRRGECGTEMKDVENGVGEGVENDPKSPTLVNSKVQ